MDKNLIVNSKDKKEEEAVLSNDSSMNILKEVLQFKVVYWGPGESGKTRSFR